MHWSPTLELVKHYALKNFRGEASCYSLLFVLAQEKTLKLQGELAENQRASEADRNELVAAKVQRLLAEKERDEQAEKCLLACQQRETVRKEAEEKEKQLKTLKVYIYICVCVCVHACVRVCMCVLACVCVCAWVSTFLPSVIGFSAFPPSVVALHLSFPLFLIIPVLL